MKPTIIALLIAGSLAACNRDKGDENSAPGAATKNANTKKGERAAIYSEPEALGVLGAIDDGEVQLANVARDVSQNEEVLRFASILSSDHRGLKQIIGAEAVKAGITPSDGAAAVQLRTESDSIARALGTVPVGFNNTWAEEQVKAHQKALAILDTAVLPSIKNKEVRALLDRARPTMVAHLQRSLQILALRRKQTAERGDPWVSGIQQAGGQAGAVDSMGRPSAPPVSRPAPQPALQPSQPAQPAPDTASPPPTSTSNM